MRAAGEIPASQDDIGAARFEGLQQSWQVLRIVFEIRILDGDEITRRFTKSGTERSTLALIPSMRADFDRVVSFGQCLGDAEAAVGRGIINDHDFDRESIRFDGANSLDTSFEGFEFVVTGDDYGEPGRHGTNLAHPTVRTMWESDDV